MAVRLQDIAEYLGLSVSTVSLALRDAPQISEETRSRVRDAAMQLGYIHRPRQTIRTELQQIAFITNVVSTNDFYSGVLSGAEHECREHGIAMYYTLLRELTPKVLNQYAEADALLVVGSIEAQTVRRLQALGRPMVLVDNNLPHLGIDRILIENVGSVYRVVSWLAELGHQRIAFLCGPDELPSFSERRLGYRSAMQDWGLEPFEIANRSMQELDIAKAVLNHLQPDGSFPFTALIAYHDRAAIFVMHALQDQGLSIPDDLSIVGFDHSDLVRMARPALATCQVYRDMLGMFGVRRLIERAQNPELPVMAITFDTVLIEGASVQDVQSSLDARKF
jgi:LacI family repressor for deo operon, udp, cdd, tsx, nupC, and nupG